MVRLFLQVGEAKKESLHLFSGLLSATHDNRWELRQARPLGELVEKDSSGNYAL